VKLVELENVERFISTLPSYELKDVYVNGTKLQNYKAVCYQGTNKVVAIVSNKYKLTNHDTVFNIVMEKAIQKFGKENLKGWVEHTSTKAYLFLTFKEVDIQNDSTYNCGLVVTNSVNTQLSIWLNLMTYRNLCSNLLVQRGNVLAIQNKHLGTSEFWDRFKQRLFTVLNEFDSILKQEFTFLDQIKTITVQSDFVRKEILNKLNTSKKAYYLILKQLTGTDTLFNVYQAITNYYTNTRSMNVYNRVQHIKKARELIEDDMKQVLKGD
jgi:hypothetical protein